MSSHRVGPQGAAVGPLPPQGSVGQPMWNPPQGFAAASPFTPTDDPNLWCWVDFTDTTTLWQESTKTNQVASDGDTIGYAADKSGNGNDWSQATAAQRPTYQTAEINSLAVAEGDGTDDNLDGPTPANTAKTIILVCRTLVGYGANDVFFDCGTGAVNRLRATAAGAFDWYANEATGVEAIGGDCTAASIVTIKAVSTGSVIIYVNGTQEASFDPKDSLITGGTGSSLFVSVGGAGEIKGQIGEMIWSNAALTDTVRGNHESYLATRWGITLA